MPNLLRTPSMPSVPSMPCLVSPVNPPSHGPSSLPTIPSLRSSQSFDSSSGLARLQSSSSKTVFLLTSVNKSAVSGPFFIHEIMTKCFTFQGKTFIDALVNILSTILEVTTSNF